MKLFNFKSFPFFCCLLGLSVPSKVYCAPRTNKTVVRGKNTKNSSTVKKVETEKKEVTLDKKNVSPAKNAKASENVKKEEDKKVVEQKDEKKNADSKGETSKKEVTLDITEKKVENKKIETVKKIEDNLEVKEKNKKNSELKEETDRKIESKKDQDEEKKSKRTNGRRRRGGRAEVVAEESNKKNDDKGEKQSKAYEEKRGRRAARRGRAVKKEVKKTVIEENNDDISVEEENFVGISSTEYLNNLTNLLDSYTGKANVFSDIREKLSGDNLKIYDESYKPYDENGNQNLKRHDIQFKNQLIRRIDLKEKVNLPFFRANKEITKFFLEGIQNGKLDAYFDPFFSQKMTQELLREQLLIPKDIEATVDNDNVQELLFDAHDISVLELNANWIFDKNTSDFTEDPCFLKLIIPAEKFQDTTKIQRVVCYIRYVDAVNFLKSIPNASWIDEQNEAVELAIGEAFSMKLFDSVITFIGNRDCNNGDVVDKWGTREGDASYASRKAEDFKYKFEGSLDSI